MGAGAADGGAGRSRASARTICGWRVYIHATSIRSRSITLDTISLRAGTNRRFSSDWRFMSRTASFPTYEYMPAYDYVSYIHLRLA